jgi:class 3 adenylate cyclase
MSVHLDNIIKNHGGRSNLQVVFVDIEKYSKRRGRIQNEAIGYFSSFLREALEEVSQKYVDYSQKNNLNLKEDTIILPTGDGAGIVFSFDGLDEIHLEYAKALLKKVYDFNEENKCERISRDGYCNDHPNFNLRVGISAGDGLIYRDVNDRYNAAGDVVNMAARVMDLADRNQIVFTDQARAKFFEMVDRDEIGRASCRERVS